MGTITDIEGIGDVYGENLKDIGITTTEALLEAGKDPKGRSELAGEDGDQRDAHPQVGQSLRSVPHEGRGRPALRAAGGRRGRYRSGAGHPESVASGFQAARSQRGTSTWCGRCHPRLRWPTGSSKPRPSPESSPIELERLASIPRWLG